MGVVILRSERDVAFANNAARAMASEAEGLALTAFRLFVARYGAAQRLPAAIQRSAQSADGRVSEDLDVLIIPRKNGLGVYSILLASSCDSSIPVRAAQL